MSLATLSPDTQATCPTRPKFNSHITSDRLRVGSGLYSTPFKTGCNLRKGRRSVFKEMGLDDEFDASSSYESPHPFAEQRRVSSPASPSPGVDEQKDLLPAAMVAGNGSPTSPPPRGAERQASLPSKPWYAKLTVSKARAGAEDEDAGAV